MNIPESPARQKWRQIIRRQQSSGLGVAEFCRNQMIPPSSFFGWRRKLTHSQAATFVEATLAPRPAGIELRLRGGRRLLLCRGFDRRDRLAHVTGAGRFVLDADLAGNCSGGHALRV
jgi:hypothetical protein